MRTHLGQAPYKCRQCNYSSADKSTLVRHLRTHNGERPFQCTICHFAFTTKANCERHVRYVRVNFKFQKSHTNKLFYSKKLTNFLIQIVCQSVDCILELSILFFIFNVYISYGLQKEA